MPYSIVYLSIGSNSGDRRALIGRAVAALSSLPGVISLRTSDFYRSAPWGFESPNEFLNIAVAVRYIRRSPWTEAEAEALLDNVRP